MDFARKEFRWVNAVLGILLSGLVGLSLAGCGPSISETRRVEIKPPSKIKPPVEAPPRKAYPLSGKSYTINGQRYWILASAQSYVEEGLASWYGRDFHGKKTASGERYNMHDLTAAHKTLPLGTWVKVTNLSNMKSITVKINDRGPFVKGRIIDLSYVAAKQLGLVDAGTAWVRVEALGAAEKRKIGGKMTTVLVQPKSYKEGRFTVQVGAFRERENAEKLRARLKKRYSRVWIETFKTGNDTFYRVRVSEKNTIGQALDLQDKLEKEGFKDCFVVAR